MITDVRIKNLKSIVDAHVKLSPFTLIIGANGSGKTNFLQALKVASELSSRRNNMSIAKHINYPLGPQIVHIANDSGQQWRHDFKTVVQLSAIMRELADIRIFSIDPSLVGQAEQLTPKPQVGERGTGVVKVLDALKTGDREDLFEKIETSLIEYIPEIEKLSFIPQANRKHLQVREKHLNRPVPVSLLSEGTKFVIAILTIIYQEKPPTVICIEEIDRGLHPRLFEKIIQVCFDISHKENMPQIIATTHNPYLLDQFKDHEEAVIIVEKVEGKTSFTSLAERIKALEPDGEDPLGELWFSGFVGGVPNQGGRN